jgi:exopolyphosphatase / guanosine-5'-triphosphate,3'-diphosphate pyrophosphatase
VRLAAVDIGTNTVRLLISDVGPDGTRDVIRLTEVVGLGRGVAATGRLSRESIDRALAVLTGYGGLIDRSGVDGARAVATSASRDAVDAPSFLERAGAALGVMPDLIGGDEEAALSFAGAVAGSPGPSPVLVIDPGGGSTEFVFGDERPRYSISIDVGSVRLTDGLLPDRPAPPHAVAASTAHVRGMLAAVELPGRPARVLGVAGTFTSLCALDLGLQVHDRALVHGATLSVEAIERLVDRLAGLTVEETAAIPSLEPGRAPVLLAGAVVAVESVRCSGHDAVTVSEADLLDGIVLELAARVS